MNKVTQQLKGASRRIRLGSLAMGLCVCVLWPASGRSQQPHPDPSMNPIPQFDFNNSAKSILVKLLFDGPTDVSLVSAAGMFGRAQTNAGKPPMLRVRLYDHYDNKVEEFHEWSPLLIEALDVNPLVTTAPAATGLFSFRFDPALRAMSVTDIGLNQELIDVDLVGAILDFCAAHPSEPECGVDLAILSFIAVDAPSEILVGEPVEITLRKRITNNGPLGIMDTKLTAIATATPGSTISPPQLMREELKLIINEVRQLDEVFTIECQSFSAHPFTVENEIAPLNPAYIDPDPTNNKVELEIPIECVLPVAINIHPHGSPNSINIGSNGSVPVAVLTTTAGEYGTPLDFDATKIVPTSVRFGRRATVFSESGGAAETHARGHIEKSYELDEQTKDADEDMVLHFDTRDTGLQTGDVEACVKGQWLDDNGNPHKFFGCDAVRIVP